jgi:hypothetical protein
MHSNQRKHSSHISNLAITSAVAAAPAVLQCCSEHAQSTAGDRWSTTGYDDRAVHTRRTTATSLSSLAMYTACSIGAAAWRSDVSAAAAIELACTAACYHHSSINSSGELHSKVSSTCNKAFAAAFSDMAYTTDTTAAAGAALGLRSTTAVLSSAHAISYRRNSSAGLVHTSHSHWTL